MLRDVLPKTLVLLYPPGFKADGDTEAFLPKVLHTRPSASSLESYMHRPGELPRAVFRSAYDALTDILIEVDIVANEGEVKRIYFEEN